ncbi:hypothetical protein DWU98_02460 [Dyella monticola]|uniref:Uncharacterized protein n=1 Tax=Dyella monticola TaxID=1927958 RepID=A0A370X985_9GAMM|nr:hypothetical protein DWU98_02460 [Dyella monticola]
MLKQTSKQVVSDGAGWRLEKGLPGGNGPTYPSRADELREAQTVYDRAKVRDDAAQVEKTHAESQLTDAITVEGATRQNFSNAWVEWHETMLIANDYTQPAEARAGALEKLPGLERVRDDTRSAYTSAITARQTADTALERARTHAATTTVALRRADQSVKQMEQRH